MELVEALGAIAALQQERLALGDFAERASSTAAPRPRTRAAERSRAGPRRRPGRPRWDSRAPGRSVSISSCQATRGQACHVSFNATAPGAPPEAPAALLIYGLAVPPYKSLAARAARAGVGRPGERQGWQPAGLAYKGRVRRHIRAPGRISSAVEQRFCKPKVGGSIPSSGTSPSSRLTPSSSTHTRAGTASASPALSLCISRREAIECGGRAYLP